MGNCCMAASSMEWDGEDWSDLMSNKQTIDEAKKEKLMGSLRASGGDANRKVMKIKVLKKELEELLEKQQQSNMKHSAEQVLLRLIKTRVHEYGSHGLWKPELETIPEVS